MAPGALPPQLQAHFLQPRHAGALEQPTGRGTAENQACGDRIEFQVCVAAGRLAEVAWSGRGCSAVLACASHVATRMQGSSIEQARATDWTADLRALCPWPVHRQHALALIERAVSDALA
jgi:NifU-like protein involved in Fe-S cluster formation